MGVQITDWEVVVVGDNIVHVLPVKDIHPHKYAYCQCNPRFEPELRVVLVVHKAFDQRPTGEAAVLPEA